MALIPPNIRTVSKQPDQDELGQKSWRERLRIVIFEAETSAGKAFDVVLIIAIVLSVLVVMIESVPELEQRYDDALHAVEWVFTILFTIEYILRLVASHRPTAYARSFFGIVDLLSFLPTYISALVPGAQSLLVIRVLRLLRIFRILKLVRFVKGADVLLRAMISSRAKILVFFTVVTTFVIIAGTIMYLVEGPQNGFTSIPMSVYWAVVTVTTVGFGDVVPGTPLGRFIASLCMMAGYAIIAVPTGIVTSEILQQGDRTTDACPACGVHGHLPDAHFCRRCGEKLQ